MFASAWFPEFLNGKSQGCPCSPGSIYGVWLTSEAPFPPFGKGRFSYPIMGCVLLLAELSSVGAGALQPASHSRSDPE